VLKLFGSVPDIEDTELGNAADDNVENGVVIEDRNAEDKFVDDNVANGDETDCKVVDDRVEDDSVADNIDSDLIGTGTGTGPDCSPAIRSKLNPPMLFGSEIKIISCHHLPSFIEIDLAKIKQN
jgi:hypothetical protein